MKPGAVIDPANGPGSRVLTINSGSSSIKFALYAVGDPPKRLLSGLVDRVGVPGSTFRATGPDGQVLEDRGIDAADREQAADYLARWLRERIDAATLSASATASCMAASTCWPTSW